jgi:hypothetical protein
MVNDYYPSDRQAEAGLRQGEYRAARYDRLQLPQDKPRRPTSSSPATKDDEPGPWGENAVRAMEGD